MSMAISETSAPPAPQRKLRIALIVLGAIMALRALADSPIISYDFGQTERTLSTRLEVTLPHVLAVAALFFAIRDRLRHALIALAALVLVHWTSELSSLATHGLEMSATVPGLMVFARQLIYPAIAIATIVLAVRNKRLELATAFVALPALAIGAGIYGS